MKYCSTLLVDENKPVTSFSYHLKEAWIDYCALWFCLLTWKEGSCDILYKNSYFCVYYLTKSNAVFCKRQIISCSFITWNHTLIYSMFWKLLMRIVRLYFFSGTYGRTTIIRILTRQEACTLLWNKKVHIAEPL